MRLFMATILLVEDDAPLMRLYEGGLANEHDIFAVESAGAALESIQTNPPDLIVLDLNLPDAPGTTILDYLATVPELGHVQVIVMTGFAHFKNQPLPSSVVQVLAKPVT